MSASVKSAYQDCAALYDEDFFSILSRTQNLGYQQLIQRKDLSPQANILDLAVGTGTSFDYLMRHFPQAAYYGHDLSEAMLEEAKKKLVGRDQKITWTCSDAAQIGQYYKPNSLDAILSHYLFSYVDRYLLLQESQRLLKPGGYFSIITTTKENFSDFVNPAKKLEQYLGINKVLNASYTPDNFNQLLDDAAEYGFDVVSIKRFNQPILFYKFNDLKEWVYKGWGASYLFKHAWLKMNLMRLAFYASYLIFPNTFPLSVTSDIGIILLKKR